MVDCVFFIVIGDGDDSFVVSFIVFFILSFFSSGLSRDVTVTFFFFSFMSSVFVVVG